ncbi:hypothetical protein [Reichenbachiella versicolor]|uniref:hypothetical protein n=1 Tax=Reichenbachiella versicolor TaxID=1821036 RepID=UPI000D6E5DF6|nr:hypothetical protein [Reichenbachiella versicolor]
MTFILPVIIIVGVFGYLFYIKKSGKLGAFQQNHIDAEEDMKQNFQMHFQNLKSDEETFKPIIDIIGKDFNAIVVCKKPKDVLGAVTDTAKTMVTGVVVESNLIHTLVLTDDTLHYLEYSTQTKKATEHWEFEKGNIEDLVLEQGKLTDNLKQSMSFQLQGGGRSGDQIDNSQMKKLRFSSLEKKYEFFIYDQVGFGKGFATETQVGGLGMNQSKEDIVKGMLLPVKLANVFFEKVEKFTSQK